MFGTLHTNTAASTIDRIIDQFPADRQSQIRVMLSESLIPAVSNLIREDKTFQIPSIIQTNRKSGMVTLNDALLELVDQGQVEAEEAYMKAVDKAGFAQALKAKRHDVSFLGEA